MINDCCALRSVLRTNISCHSPELLYYWGFFCKIFSRFFCSFTLQICTFHWAHSFFHTVVTQHNHSIPSNKGVSGRFFLARSHMLLICAYVFFCKGPPKFESAPTTANFYVRIKNSYLYSKQFQCAKVKMSFTWCKQKRSWKHWFLR